MHIITTSNTCFFVDEPLKFTHRDVKVYIIHIFLYQSPGNLNDTLLLESLSSSVTAKSPSLCVQCASLCRVIYM